MTTKTEAERRYEMFLSRGGFSMDEANHAKALLRAIFEPLPPEPEPVKSLGALAADTFTETGSFCEVAQAVVTAHEARRPKPTLEELTRAMHAQSGITTWEASTPEAREAWRKDAREVFQLFGVTP